MDERQQQELIAKAQVGAELREFLKTPGYAVIQKFIDDKVELGYKDWLRELDPAKRELLWQTTHAYGDFQNFLKRTMLEGDGAASILHTQSAPPEDM